MSIQKSTLILMILWSSTYAVGADDLPLFSPLFPVERESFFNLMRELGSVKQAEQEILDSQRIHARLNTLLIEYTQFFADLYEQSRNTEQEINLQLLGQKVQCDANFTPLIKDMVEALCREREFLLSVLITYHRVKRGDCTNDEYLIALRSYLPKNIDVVQFSFEHFVWSFRYLYRTFEDKRVLTMGDIFFVVERIESYFQLPEKSKNLWNNLMFIFKNDMKDISREVQYYMICNAKEVVKDSNFYLVYKILRSLAKFRREGLKTRGTEYEKLVDCSGMINKMLAAIRSVERINKLNSNITAMGVLERLIFKEK